MKKYLFLFGVDYSDAFNKFNKIPENFWGIVPTNEPLFTEDAQRNLENLFQEKLFKVGYSIGSITNIIDSINPDVLISMGWRRILSGEIIKKVPTCINIHPALLPEYKGYHTEPYIISNNEKYHGITAHILTEGLDDGDIVSQEKFPISSFSTVKSLKSEINKILPNFLFDLIKNIDNDTIKLNPQDSTLNKIIAKKRTPADSEIDPNLPLIKLYHSIRACDPDVYPAFFFVDGEKINIKVWRESKNKENNFDL